MHIRNTSAAFLPHTGCKPQSPHKQSPSPDPAATRSTPATPPQAPPPAPKCCASHPWSSCALRENKRGRESAPAWPAPKAETKTRPAETSDACCANDPERKPRSETAL